MGENAAGAAKANPPPRPTIALPPRSAYYDESLFPDGGAAMGVSTGPMTLVSSFFAVEDPDSDCRSFSQLLAGAMASPAAGKTVPQSSSSERELPAAAAADAAPDAPAEETEREGISGSARPHRPLDVTVAPSPFFTVQPGLSPASLWESPAFFSLESFGISHQQALAQGTAQAAQAHSYMNIQAEYPSNISAISASLMQLDSSADNSALLQRTPPLVSTTKTTTLEAAESPHSDQRSQPASLIVDKPAEDGYNWRKYGQKQVKGCEYPRSYYKCTHPHCPVKKKVERSFDGQVTGIIYTGEHNHQKPPPSKCAKEGVNLPIESNELNGNLDLPTISETGVQGHMRNFYKPEEYMADSTASKGDWESGQATPERLSGSSDGEEVDDAEERPVEGDDSKPDPKRRKIDVRVIELSSSHRAVIEPRIVVQTTSEVDLLDDGYRWRKYGQKVVKGNPHPRSYYKCTNAGCNVRKHVERASTDPKAVITSYEGKHKHDVPAARNSSHNVANTGAGINAAQNLTNDQALLKRTDFRYSDLVPLAVLQLKEEH